MSSARKLAGPFVPVEDIEWCTVHHGVRNEDDYRCDMSDDPDDCHDYVDEDVEVDDNGQCADCRCHLVTLYIEVES